ncbi:hypothetical protein [Novipirellula aureliae]|uniref:hypothetical protein n=1 Tax=Novipirellula aureliae TaxID=2527966 RepID=UPI001E56646B|nr:hypothetical protein [Novipirellula aureliae]
MISTEWHELLVPFAESRARADMQMSGYELVVDSSGNPTVVAEVVVPELTGALDLFRTHSNFLFADKDDRDAASQRVIEAAKENGASGFITVLLEYEGHHPAVIHRFSVYLVPTAIAPNLRKPLEHFVMEENEDAEEGFDLQFAMQEELLGRVSGTLGAIADEFCIGSPEHFSAMLHQGWKPKKTLREGQLASSDFYSDEQIVQMIHGMEGANALQFMRVFKSSNQLDFDDAVKSSQRALLGNENWTLACDVLFSRGKLETTSVFADIYNCLCLPETLYAIAKNGDFGYSPKLQIVVNQSDGKSSEAFSGFVAWDGDTCPESPDVFFQSLSGGLENFYMQKQVGAAWQLDEKAMHLHGLTYGLVRLAIRDGAIASGSISYDGGETWRDTEPGIHACNLNDFVERNAKYVDAFTNYIDGYVGRF